MKNVSKVLIILIIMISGLSNVKAVNNNFNIEDISIEEQSDTINASTPIYDENIIDSKIEFNKVGDYIKYKVVFKNNSDKIYKIKSIEDINSDYISVLYEYKKDEINPKEKFEIYVTIKYIDEVYSDEVTYNLNDISLKVKLEELIKEEKDVTIDVNPNTSDDIRHYAIMLLITLIGLILLIKTKKKIFMITLIALLGITGYVKAESDIEIIFSFKNNIINVNKNKFNDITNEELGITKENIQNIYFVKEEDLPDNIEGSFDISIHDDERIMEYYVKNDDDEYDIYITSSDMYSKYNSKDLSYLLSGYTDVKTIDLTYLDLSNVTDMNHMFYEDTKLEKIIWPDDLDTSKVIDMSYLFGKCESLSEIDVSNFDTSNVTNMRSMFYNCSKLTELDVSNFDTSNVTDMSYMFYKNTELNNLDISSFDTSNVTSMRSMFYNCSKLIELDVSNFDTSNVEEMNFMFMGCSSLKSIDVSNFNTSKVTTMKSLFNNCNSLEQLDLNNFDTSNVTDMSFMFQYCNNLKTLNISNFDTSNVTNMSYMFNYCNSLTELDVSSFNTSNVTNMATMFQRCDSLKTLNVSNFDTSNVTDMGYIFGSCYNLETIYLGSFSTKSAIYIYNMFRLCSSLKTIYVNNDFEIAEGANSKYMFLDAKNIVGGNGTTYNNRYTNATYARIDTEETPGYFTQQQE